ncbi:MAG: efflux RND transporter permease subunit [Cyclonatronaceae bacterium]
MKLVDLSVRRRVTIAMFTVGILLFGAVSLSRLNISLLPDLSYPTLTIRTEYTGAAPAEIENLITKPIEEALGAVKNVNQIRSISRSGISDVTLEFDWGTDMDYAGLDVREKLDIIRLPLEATRPVLLRFDPTLEPVIRYALFQQHDDERSAEIASVQNEELSDLKFIRRFADEHIKKELEAGGGVASVKISGGLEEEIQVLVDQQRLAYLNIPIEQLTSVLRAENINLSGGRLEEGSQHYLVRTLNQFQNIEQIHDVVVAHRDGRPVYLRDVAMVGQSYKEREAITRIRGEEAVEIAIYKEGDANTVAVARTVENRIGNVNNLLPPELKLVKVYDQSTFINQAVDEVIKAGLIGGLLAMIILFIFLRDVRSTLIISLSIPVSVIATFNLMYSYDITLNIMSLGGIALGIGLLVDNSIVVLENISRHRAQGKNAFLAAKEGAGEVGMAVVASTLTTVAVFFPLVFVEGIAGQLFRDQALTVTFSLLASLLVALTLIPMLASLKKEQATEPVPVSLAEPRSRIGRVMRHGRVFIFNTIPVYVVRLITGFFKIAGSVIMFFINPLLNVVNDIYNRAENFYPKVLKTALQNRTTVLGTALLLFIGTMFMIPRLGIELIPSLAQGTYNIEFRMPPGTPLHRTDKAIQGIQLAAAADDRIDLAFSVAGSGNRMDANPDQGGENWGEMNIKLKPGYGTAHEQATMADMRFALETIPGLQYKFSRPALFSFRTPVEIEITGYELDDLKRISDRIAEKLRTSDRYADVKSTMEQGHPEISIHFDREKAAALGLQVHEAANRIVSKVRGDVATKYSWRDQKIDVLVRTREKDRSSVDDIRQLIINPESEKPVTLDAIAEIRSGMGPGEIRRVSQQRVALVTANLNYGDLGSAAQEIGDIIRSTPMPAGIQASIGGQNQEMDTAFRSLLMAILLAIFLVYLVMASQFESLVHPFVILFTIPLALIGAVWALWITGSTVSVVVFIGLILLAGIVVNNAIVLIDLINQLRAKGMEKLEAIIEGGRLRMRPIMMTTLTTVLGLLPLSIGFGEGAEIRAPMGITVIGGLLISTLLTLIVIPVVYAILDRKKFTVLTETASAGDTE